MRGRFRLFWLILAVLFAGMAGFACFFAMMYGSIYNQPDADPVETVTGFFDSLQVRNYPEAYACLSDYASLGLENEPESADARAVMMRFAAATVIRSAEAAASPASRPASGLSCGH